MRASISFLELSGILLDKAGQNISFAYVDEKTIHLNYPLNLGVIKSSINADLIVVDLEGSNLLVQVTAGKGTETLLNTVLGLLKNKIPEGLIEKQPDNHFLLHLDKIEQVKSVFDAITVSDFRVLEEGLEVEGALKA